MKHFEAIKEKLNRIMAAQTGRTYEEIVDACERDHFMTPEEAQEFGLIDKIITKR